MGLNDIGIINNRFQQQKVVILLQMWKNQTTPNLHSSLSQIPIIQSSHPSKYCQLSFADTEPKQFGNLSQNKKQNMQIGSINMKSLEDLLCNFRSKNSSTINQDNNTQMQQNCDGNSICGTKLSKQQMIVMELQKNQQLRINLFKAEKTIGDLETVFRNLQQKILKTLNYSKQETDQKLNQGNKKANKRELSENIQKEKKTKEQQQKQNKNEKSMIIKKQAQIAEIWKNCYSDLIQYVNSYTKDITFLTEQYRVLEAQQEVYKNKNQMSKKNQRNLLKILKQSNQKLHKSQQTIQKAIDDINERDRKIEEYQLENKNIKMKILQYLQQIQRLKRENKLQIRDNLSYKQVAKSLQEQLKDYEDQMEDLRRQIQNKQKMEEIYKQNEEAWKHRMQSLEDQIKQTRVFNENVIDEYKKLSSKIYQNEQKLNERCQGFQKIYEQRIKQYQKNISNLKRQKQLLVEKHLHKFQLMEQQLKKNFKLKATLQKQLRQKSSLIEQLQQQKIEIENKHEKIEHDRKVMMEQKDRQIQYLEQIKNINIENCEELKLELEEVRTDMLLIIQQLKVKQLEIEKLRFLYQTDSKVENEDELQNKKKEESKKKEGKIHRNIPIQTNSNPANKNSKQTGLIWKKMKKQSSSAVFENALNQSLTIEQYKQTEQIAQQQQQPRMGLSRTMPRLQHIELYDEVPQLIRLVECEQQYCENEARVSPKFNFSGCNKIKFSLQAFQNKLVLEENAKTLFKLNKTVFR